MVATRSADGTLVVSERRCRATGTIVQVIDNRDGSFDATDLPWFNLCVDHGSVVSHKTRRLAEDWASVPDQWCPDCRGDKPDPWMISDEED